MTRHISLWIDKNTQALCMCNDTMYISRSIVLRTMTVLHTRIRQAAICWPMNGETFCIVYMPVEDIEVVLVKHVQEIEDGWHRKELPARVQHEASVRVEIGLHLLWILEAAGFTTRQTRERGHSFVARS
jgi:hypothetical protein